MLIGQAGNLKAGAYAADSSKSRHIIDDNGISFLQLGIGPQYLDSQLHGRWGASIILHSFISFYLGCSWVIPRQCPQRRQSTLYCIPTTCILAGQFGQFVTRMYDKGGSFLCSSGAAYSGEGWRSEKKRHKGLGLGT